MVELTEAGRAAKREYKRSWSAQNRERMRDAEARYWNKRGEELAAAKKDEETRG